MIYRQYNIEVPKEHDETFRAVIDEEIRLGRIDKNISYREMAGLLFLRGLADLRNEQIDRKRGSKLVMLPQEMAAAGERLRALKHG